MVAILGAGSWGEAADAFDGMAFYEVCDALGVQLECGLAESWHQASLRLNFLQFQNEVRRMVKSA